MDTTKATRSNDVELASRVEEFMGWLADAKIHTIIDPEDLTAEQFTQLEEMAKRAKETDEGPFVWTHHSTCEDEVISDGVHLVGNIPQLGQEDNGHGCYQISSFFLGDEPPTDDFIPASFWRHCPKCDPNEDRWDEDGEGDPDCDVCYGDMYFAVYFEDYVSLNLTDKLELGSRIDWKWVDIKEVLGL